MASRFTEGPAVVGRSSEPSASAAIARVRARIDGGLYDGGKDPKGAFAAEEEAIATRRAMAAEAPSNVPFQQQLVVDLKDVTLMLIQSGDNASAAKAADEALGDAQQLAGAHPADTPAQYTLGEALTAESWVSVAKKDYPTAVARLQDGLAILHKHAAADPTDASAQIGIALQLERLAAVPGSNVGWSDVAAQWRTVRARGLLSGNLAVRAAYAERQAATEAGQAAAPPKP